MYMIKRRMNTILCGGVCKCFIQCSNRYGWKSRRTHRGQSYVRGQGSGEMVCESLSAAGKSASSFGIIEDYTYCVHEEIQVAGLMFRQERFI